MKPSTVFLIAGSLFALCCLACGDNCVDECSTVNCVSPSCYQQNCNSCANNCDCSTVASAQSCTARCHQCNSNCRTTSCRKNIPAPERIELIDPKATPEGKLRKQENSKSNPESDSSHASSNNITSVFDITSSVSNNNTIHMPLMYSFNHYSNVTVTPAGSPSISINITAGSAPEPSVVIIPKNADIDKIIQRQTTDEKHDKTANIDKTIRVTPQCCNISEEVPCHHDKTSTCYQYRRVCGPECQRIAQVPYAVHERVPQPYVVKQAVYIPQPYPVYKQLQVPIPQPYPFERQIPVHQPNPVVQRVNVPPPYPFERPIIIPQPYPVMPQDATTFQQQQQAIALSACSGQTSPCLLNVLQGVTSACSGGITRREAAPIPSIPWTRNSAIGTRSNCNYLNQAPWIQRQGLAVGLQDV